MPEFTWTVPLVVIEMAGFVDWQVASHTFYTYCTLWQLQKPSPSMRVPPLESHIGQSVAPTHTPSSERTWPVAQLLVASGKQSSLLSTLLPWMLWNPVAHTHAPSSG